jgi:hypothetical protein
VVHLPEMLDKYGDRAEFLFVYTQELGMSMATHSHQLPESLRDLAEPPEAPRGSRLRLTERVRAGKKHFNLQLPCLLDNEQCDVQTLYGANPKRLVIVDSAGRIALDSGTVPSASFPWKEVADWLDHHGGSASLQSAEKHG